MEGLIVQRKIPSHVLYSFTVICMRNQILELKLFKMLKIVKFLLLLLKFETIIQKYIYICFRIKLCGSVCKESSKCNTLN